VQERSVREKPRVAYVRMEQLGVEETGEQQFVGPQPVLGRRRWRWRRLAGEVGAVVRVLAEARLDLAPDELVQAAQIEKARLGVEDAARLGAPRALVVAYKIEESVPPERVRRHCAGLVKELMPVARRLGVTLTSANLGIYWRYFGKGDHIHAVRADAGPELRFTYDIGNFLIAGDDPLEWEAPGDPRPALRRSTTYLRNLLAGCPGQPTE
jgi:sugar phosphate isomerase/epimerase